MRFYLIPYLLNGDKKKYKSVFYPAETLDLDALIERYMMNYGTSATKTDSHMIVNLFFKAIEDALEDGHTVQTDLFRARIKVEGNFDTILENFNKSKHRVRPQFIASVPLVERFAKLKAKLIRNPRFQPHIYSLYDVFTQSTNSLLTPGGMAEVHGKKLIFDTTDEEQGYFLIDEKDTITRIDHFARNFPATCMLQLPSKLTPGHYTLEFRGIPGKGRSAVRIALDKPLRVQ